MFDLLFSLTSYVDANIGLQLQRYSSLDAVVAECIVQVGLLLRELADEREKLSHAEEFFRIKNDVFVQEKEIVDSEIAFYKKDNKN